MAIHRRHLLQQAALWGGALALDSLMPSWAQSGVPDGVDAPDVQALTIASQPFLGGHGCAVNGMIPAPLLRWRQGQTVRLAVTNQLAETTSLHWHGLLVPFQFDGVPGISFPGIAPGETFTYQFPLLQAGTYWYHGHSGMQEAMGLYGPIIIDPETPDPVAYDREHVLVLADWSPRHPHTLMRKLKQQSGSFNHQRQTLAGLLAGRDQTLAERGPWAKMRMDPTDIADIGGQTYSYLVNGHGPDKPWVGLFVPGERVRLRIINAAAMSYFNVRIPGLSMQVVQADGQNVRTVAVDELQIAVAETYDVIVQPEAAQAFAVVAEAMDRSGMASAVLAPQAGMRATLPPLRARPLLTMRDMGMMDHGSGHEAMAMPMDRTGDPGIGLESVGHRVLTYRDLVALDRNPDTRSPSRTLEIRLTGDMERYMWSFDGQGFSALTTPLSFAQGERVRVTLVNETMMAHPIHLHGHFFELVTGQGAHAPRKHTVTVQPGGTVTFDLTADALGDWAFHCHLLMHMHAGMFQIVRVRVPEAAV